MAIDTLINHDFFNKYLILSPSIWINRDNIIKNIQSKIFRNKEAIYTSVGSFEFDENGNMIEDLEIFYQELPKGTIKSKMDII